MTSEFYLQMVATADIRYTTLVDTPDETRTLCNVHTSSEGMAAVHVNVLDAYVGTERMGLVAANGEWMELAFDRLLDRICQELVGDEPAALTTLATVATDAIQGVHHWGPDDVKYTRLGYQSLQPSGGHTGGAASRCDPWWCRRF